MIAEDRRVYPPSEDTYLLLEAIDLDGASSFVEIGTGTGMIALQAARQVEAVATDISEEAVHLCRGNAETNGLDVEVIRTDLFAGLNLEADVIAFNPPYLPDRGLEHLADPAWSGGRDGNKVIFRFLEQARDALSPGGRVYLLLSSHNSKALRRAVKLYDVRCVAQRSLFFEEIGVYRLQDPPLQ